jgi:quercetin dioxygenase-like cupin family protein
MPVMKYRETPGKLIAHGTERRVGHTDRLMIALVDFSAGPQERPEPAHSHPHDQAGYVAEGEILLFLGSEEHRLITGDLFFIPSGVPHTVRRLTRRVRLVECFTPLREDFLGT